MIDSNVIRYCDHTKHGPVTNSTYAVVQTLFEPHYVISNNAALAKSEFSDQTAHKCSLIRAFTFLTYETEFVIQSNLLRGHPRKGQKVAA